MTRPNTARRDGGFSLVETVIALAVIGIVMAAVTTFLTATQRVTRRQDDSDAAAQLATAAMSRVRSIKGSALVVGRDVVSSNAQWNDPAAGVAPYLANITEVWDTSAPAGSGANASLPTVPTAITVGNLTYQQHVYVGRCWQPATGGLCAAKTGSTDIPILKVIVAITWHDNVCAANTCSYVTATLSDPNPNDPIFIAP